MGNTSPDRGLDTSRIPHGPYCYRRVPSPESGFGSNAELEAYLDKKHGPEWSGDWFVDWCALTVSECCPYWNPTEHGFVECTYLDQRALWLAYDDTENMAKAIAHFGSAEEANRQITGFLLGDACKVCRINLPERPHDRGTGAERGTAR